MNAEIGPITLLRPRCTNAFASLKYARSVAGERSAARKVSLYFSRRHHDVGRLAIRKEPHTPTLVNFDPSVAVYVVLGMFPKELGCLVF